MTVSIIVPIYHGKTYIPSLMDQAEKNAEHTTCHVELLLVNDDPQTPLNEKRYSSSVQIRVINTEKNRGIHGARIRGLKHAVGEYVLFLDQDDRIAPDYIEKQLAAIGGASAVVCKAAENGKEYYHRDRDLQECIRRDYLTQRGNFIISPGQVLLRKAEIPEFWKANILKHNGADDWFLWLCMVCAGKNFACNKELLFEHCIHSGNTSANGCAMLDSMGEVYERLKNNRECTGKDLDGIKNVIERQRGHYLRERDKLFELYILLDDWMELRERGIRIADYIREQGYRKVSVYGMGRIGLRLARELQSCRIEVCSFLDRDAKAFLEETEIPIIPPEEAGNIQEPVLITLAPKEAEKVQRQLKEKGTGQVYLLSDIVWNLKQETECEYTQTGRRENG